MIRDGTPKRELNSRLSLRDGTPKRELNSRLSRSDAVTTSST
jgi:hypothetical protein